MTIKQRIILATSLCSFFTTFMSSSLNVAVSAIAEDFMVRPDHITAAVTAYVVTVSAFLIPASAIANRIGYTKTLILGAFSSCLIALLVSCSNSLLFLVLSRALQGLASAIIFCSCYAVLSYYIAPSERGTAIGINTAAVTFGLSLSPCIGGFITDYLGWQTLFYLSSFGYFCAAYLLRKVPFDPANTTFCPYLKMLMVFCGLLTVLISFSQLKAGPVYPYTLIAGLLLTTLYLYLESRSANPLLPLSLLSSNLPLSFELLGALFNYMSTFAILLMLSLYFQAILGYSASVTGLFLMVTPFLQCVCSPLIGMLSNRVNPHLLVLLGMLLSTVAMALFIMISPQTCFMLLILGQILAGLGAGIFSTPNSIIIMGSVERKEYALASSLIALARNCGMAVCMTIFSIILMHYIHAAAETDSYKVELNEALVAGFAFSTLLGIVGLICSALSSKAARKTLEV